MAKSASKPVQVLAAIAVAFLLGGLPPLGAQDKASNQAEGGPKIDPELLKLVPEELRYKCVELPPEQNAFPLLLKAGEKLVAPDDEALEEQIWKAYEREAPFPEGEVGERIAKWLGKNAEALDLVGKAVQRGRCQFPVIKGPETKLNYLSTLRDLARMKVLRAKMWALSGELENATAEVSEVVRLGRMIRNGDGALINHLVGIAVETVGMAEARHLALQRGVPPQVIRALITAVPPVDDVDGALAQVLRLEFHVSFICVLAGLDAGGFAMSQFLPIDEETVREQERELLDAYAKTMDREATVRLASDLWLRGIANTRRSWREQDGEILRDI